MKKVLFAAFLVFVYVGMAQAAGKPGPKDPVQARKELTTMGLSYNNRAQFLKAIHDKDAIAVELFLAGKGVAMEDGDGELLSGSLSAKNGDITKALLDAGATVVPGHFVRAIKEQDIDLVQQLIHGKGFSDRSINEYVLNEMLVADSKPELAAVVVNAIRPTNAKAITAKILRRAVLRKQNIEVVTQMLEKLGPNAKVAVNDLGEEVSWFPRRPLGVAAMVNSEDYPVIALLTRYGADVNAVDPVVHIDSDRLKSMIPETPLMTAATWRNPSAVAALLKAGADPNQVVRQQATHLLTTAWFNVHNTALSYVDKFDKFKKKPPADIEQRKAEVIRLLKEAGGKTPDELKSAAKEK